MAWVYVDDHVSEDMQGTCTCMHLHAPEASGTPKNDKESKERKVAPKKESIVVVSLKPKPKPKTYTYKTLRLQDLPSDKEWWAARAAEYPGVDLWRELSKALDWPGADRIKNAKLFFRNWLTKAKPTRLVVVAPSIEEQLARLKAK